MQALPNRDALGGVNFLRALCLNRDGRVHQEVPGGQVREAPAAEDGSTGDRTRKPGKGGRGQQEGTTVDWSGENMIWLYSLFVIHVADLS